MNTAGVTVIDDVDSGAASNSLRHRSFVIFITGAFISNAGSWMQNLAVPYVLYQQTHSAAWVGLAGFCTYFPGLLMAPLGGAVADRRNRRTVLLLTQSTMAAGAVALWALWVSGVHSPGAIVAVLALGGVATGMNVPSWQAFMTELVPRRALLSAVSLNAAQFNTARALGPALAGVVLATLGPAWAFAINAVSFGAVLLALALVRVEKRPRVPSGGVGVVSAYLEGVRILWADRGMRTAFIVVIAGAGLAQPMLQLVSVFADRIFGVGAVGLGFMTSAFGLGAIIGALIVGRLRNAHRSALVRWASPFLAASVIGFAVAPNVPLAMVALAVSGGAGLISMSACSTTVQLRVPELFRGRVMGFYLTGWTTAYPLGSLLQGWMGDRIGVQWTVALSGGVLAVLAMLVLLRPHLLEVLDEAQH